MMKTNLCLIKTLAIFIVLAILKITNKPGHSAQIDRCSQKLLKLSWLAKIDSAHILPSWSISVIVHSVNK